MKKENKEISFVEMINRINEELENEEREYENFIELSKKIKDLNLNDDESIDTICIIISDIIARNKVDNEKNVDTIHELVNIIREAINEIDKKKDKTPEMLKIKKILLKYKENNYDVK